MSAYFHVRPRSAEDTGLRGGGLNYEMNDARGSGVAAGRWGALGGVKPLSRKEAMVLIFLYKSAIRVWTGKHLIPLESE